MLNFAVVTLFFWRSEMLFRFRQAIQNKQRGKLSNGIILLHNNAHAHTSKLTTQFL